MKTFFTPLFVNIFSLRHLILVILLILIYLTQQIPAWGAFYAQHIYPAIASPLSRFSSLFPFSIGDACVMTAIAFVLIYPFYGRIHLHQGFLHLLGREVEFLLWVYVWFYAAWGLNYSQPHFYHRMHLKPVAYNETQFIDFAHQYVEKLNKSYTPSQLTDKKVITQKILEGYHQHAEELHIHAPFHSHLRPKTMLYSCLASKVGVTGSMAPFFCEFTINKDVRPARYPANHAHELSHLLGITNEAEANFYAYEICTHSQDSFIRYSGYYSILSYVLSNVRRLTDEKTFREIYLSIRPEIIRQLVDDQKFWREKYSPLIGKIQDEMYDSYLKHHRISSGVKNYSEVIGLILAFEQSHLSSQSTSPESKNKE